jgi:hypothetical protein
MQLPDGVVIDLSDFNDRDLWATFDITRHSSAVPVDPFSVARSQWVVGSYPGRPATAADTSLMRPGDSGLSQSYAFIACGWRATAIAPKRVIKSEAAQAYFATTSARLMYRRRVYAEWPLSELLREAPPPVAQEQQQPATSHDDPPPQHGQRFALPFRVQENLSYGVEVSPQDQMAHNALRITLAHCGVYMSIRIFLVGLLKVPVY